MRRLFRASPWVLFVLACLAGIGLVAVSLISLRSYKASADTTTAVAQVSLLESGLFINLLDAETGQRGYLLTGDEAFLEPYTAAITSIDATVEEIRTRTASNATERELVDELKPMVDAKLAELKQTLDLDKAGEHDQALALVGGGQGKAVMDNIRANLTNILTQEAGKHESARATANRRVRETEVAIGALAIVTAALLAWVFVVLRRRGVEESLRRSNQEKDEFLGMVSHELRTPITVIVGNASILQRNRDSLAPQERAQAIQDIQEESERLKQLVENMLRLSRPDAVAPPETEPLLVRRAIDKAVERHRQRYPRTDVRVDLTRDLPPVLAHEAYVDQVLQNLLSNAAKYGSKTEPIEVRAATTAVTYR